MVEVADVGILGVALKQHVGNQGFVFGMVEVRDVRWKVAQRAPKVGQVFVFHMGVEGDVNFRIVQRVLKEALCFAKHMEGENDAFLLAVQRVQRGAHRCAKDMVGVSDACLMGVGSAQRVFMGEQTSVLLMEVGRGVLFLGAQRVHVGAPIAVSSMVVESDVRL